jgi:hypothetical protein
MGCIGETGAEIDMFAGEANGSMAGKVGIPKQRPGEEYKLLK